ESFHVSVIGTFYSISHPSTGSGRQLKGPEPDNEYDSVDETLEFLEEERPRPQGSSPVYECPSRNRSFRAGQTGCEGFHPTNDQRPSAFQSNEVHARLFDRQSETADESELIVKTQTEACAKGLIVSGGGKEGIFVKDVLHESPASTIPCMREGDQILSATVFFDDIRYEDALQILEHAKPYKVQFCLKRKSPATSAIETMFQHEKNSELAKSLNISVKCSPIQCASKYSKGETGTTVERGRTKTPRRQEARISWPKFPSFTRERKMYFKRSHSTSEAEEQKTLDMSPTTSDTESPKPGEEQIKNKRTPEGKRRKKKLRRQQVEMSKKGIQPRSSETEMQTPKFDSGDVYASDKDSPFLKGDVHMSKPQTETKDTELEQPTQGKKTELYKPKIPKSVISLPNVKTTEREDDLNKSDKTTTEAEASILQPVTGIKITETKSELDLSQSIKADLDVKSPEISTTANIKMPKPQLEAEGQDKDVDIEGSHGKFKMPSFKMPKFGFSRKEGVDIDAPIDDIKAPNADIEKPDSQSQLSKMPDLDISLPKPDLEVKGPEVEFKAPALEGKVDVPEIEAKGGRGKFQLPHMKLPSFGISTPDIKVPKIKGDTTLPTVDIPLPKADLDVKSPELTVSGEKPAVDLMGPSMDIEGKGTETEGEGSKFKLPKFGISLPKVKGTGLDISSPKPEVDITLPEAKIQAKVPEVDVEPPSVEGKIEVPEIDGKGLDIKLTKPKISLPKSGISKADMKAPEAEIDANLPKGDVSLPKRAVEIKRPEVEIKGPRIVAEVKDQDIDIEGSHGKFKMPSFKMPTFGFSTPKAQAEAPEVSADISIPDVDVPTGKVGVDIEAPRVDVEKPDRKFQMPKVKMPDMDISLPRVKGPEIDIQLPKAQAGVSVSKPDLDVKGPEVELKAPALEGKVDVPEIETKGGRGKFQLPHMKIEGPDLDVDLKGKVPEIEGEGSKFKLPKFGISLPKVKGTGLDINAPKPDVDIRLPEAKIQAKVPEVDIEAPSVEGKIEIPEIDGKGLDVKLKKPKKSLPKFGISKADMKVPEAEIDVNLPKGDISLPEGAVEIKGPEVDIKGPKIEAEVKDKDIDIEGSHGKFKMPSFKMPKFGFSTPKVKAEAPEVSTDISIPDIDAPSGKVGVDIEAPRVDVEKPDSKFQMPKVKMLDMDISLPRVKGPEIDIQQPKAQADVSISKPDLDVKGPEVDLKSP
uniref:PDZ domain-containing protein n=1 Tax=Lepisosteus oculatus TaxID=7918 RepID=W5N6F8_LEPOC